MKKPFFLAMLALFLAIPGMSAIANEADIEKLQQAIRENPNDAEAQFNLGRMYDNGEGVPEDDKQAVKWYRLAAEQGHAEAQINLGVMYRDGTGVRKDDKEAIKWWQKATEQGSIGAQFLLYEMSTKKPAPPANGTKKLK